MNEAVPAVVGVPVIEPLPGFNVNPAGKAPAVTTQLVYGAAPPAAAMVWE